MAASITNVPPPSAWSSYGCRYRARAAAVECVITLIRAGRGEPSTTCFAHGRSPSATSNPEFRFPMTNTVRSAYVRPSRVST